MEVEANPNVTYIREFLCEAYCLVDIRSELNSLQNQNSINFEEAPLPRQSLDPGTFGSPGNFISPISQKKDETIDISQNMLSPPQEIKP